MIAPNPLIDAAGNAVIPQEPTPGEKTRAQGVGFYGGRVGTYYGPDSLYATTQLGSPTAPFNLFPTGVWFSGTYANYRLMRKHPIVALAESIITSPIEAGAWSYKKRDDAVPDEWQTFIEENFERLRPSVISESLEAVTMCNQPFEIVWAVEGGRMVIEQLKPLLPELTSIVVDKAGRYAGVTQGGVDDRLDAYKSWVYAHNFRTGNYYGRSRLENVRETAWADWLDTMVEKKRLKKKLSGIIPVGIHPPGAPPGAAEGVTYQTQMLEAIKNLQLYQTGIALEAMGFSEDEMRNNPELIGKSLTQIEFMDAGKVAPAQGGMISDLEHAEMLIFAGMLRSARTGLESQHGSRADAQQHTDTGVGDSARIDREIARQLNAGPVNAALVLNFGPKAKDAIYIEPAPLVDHKREVMAAVLDKLLSMPGVGDQMAETIDEDKILDGLEIDRKADFKDAMPVVPTLRGQPNIDPSADRVLDPANPQQQ